ncbi:YncE family protein [Flavobacterium sp. 3HN19-14]|uniref:YncE family protein n=1 Tax=Flavobacterium sp. 3HN19-14 TaxID=3448133 RepID=UPI003EDF749D
MKLRNFLFFAAFSAVALTSCNDDDGTSAPLGDYDNGVLVLNEGNFTTGSVTYIGDDMTTTLQDVYGAENPGDNIGGYVQSVFFDGDRAFIISNGSNKITVVNRYTFKLIDKIETGFIVPRYGVVVNGKAYVTNLNTFGDLTDDFLTVINLETLAVEAPIQVHAIAERIYAKNGKIYVANGSFGDGSSLTVINAATGAITATVDLGLSPNSMEEKDGNLYVLCSDSDNAKIVKVNLSNNTITNTVTFPAALTDAQNLDIEGNKIYFTNLSNVYAVGLNETTVSETPLFASNATFLYGFSVHDGNIFVADAKQFDTDGEVKIYGTDGVFKKQFTSGLAPNGFYFND